MEFPALSVRDLEGIDHVIPHGLVDCQGAILWRFEGPRAAQALAGLEAALQNATC